MDFSSVPRALESLHRRNPPLGAAVLETADKLLQNNGALLSSDEFSDHLQNLLQEGNGSGKDSSDKPRWEPLAVGIFVATEVLEAQKLESKDGGSTVYMEGPRVPSMNPEKEAASPDAQWKSAVLTEDQILSLCESLHPLCMEHLEHSEPRVRTLVAKAAGAYSKATLILGKGEDLRKSVHTRVTGSIQEHLAQGRKQAEANDSKYSKSSTGALDDTTGWRALETNWQCLAAIINAMGPTYFDDYGTFSDQMLKDCQYSSITHVNRHVRAAGMAVLEHGITAASKSSVHSQALLSDPQGAFCKTIVAVIKDGLADNWSQVRMAASVLCRAFLTSLQALDIDLKPMFPVLLPRMCLNRFYLAQGVKLYSHETWKVVFKNESGIGHVADNLPAVCRYYVKMCDADNHAVREAACQAIAELAVRLGEHEEYHDKLQAQIDLLMQALLMCFHDESWPVRDEACLACGILCRCYPEECRPELGTLWERWVEQLTDQIWSVREDAAVALGDYLEAYGMEAYPKIKDLVKKLVPSAKKQAAMTMAEYKARQNDAAAHTDSQLFSCGSLAPKLKKGSDAVGRKTGAGRIGCSSCDVTRDRQLWEATDGAIYLIRELVVRFSVEGGNVTLSDNEIKEYLRELIDVCRVQHFPQSDDMRATLWRQVPLMAQALGKERFKRNGYLEIFQDLLFSNLESRTASQLCKHAAGQCAEELAQLMGVAIFRGRLEDYQRDVFDDVMRERQSLPKGPAMDGAFSPFGPAGLLDNVGAP